MTISFLCPRCLESLAELGSDADRLFCQACGTDYVQDNGIWNFVLVEHEPIVAAFLVDYQAIRRAEGRGSDDPQYYRALPATAKDDPLAEQWRLRGCSWRLAKRWVFAPTEQPLDVLDLGAGVGWLCNRIAELGHRPVAVDVSTDDRDGLGAARHFATDFPRARAHFDALPFADASFDVVVFNASLHYSIDYQHTLRQALRVLRDVGRILILDSPIYRCEAHGASMVAERHADFERRYGTRSDSVPAREFLDEPGLRELGEAVSVTWRRRTPWYGWRWAARPALAHLARRRPPSRFSVLEARPVRPVARFRRTWLQRLVVAGAGLAALSSFAAAGAVGLVHNKVGQIHRVALAAVLAPPKSTAGASAARNILVVGVDNAEGLAKDDRRRLGRDDGLRSDTMMLLRLDPATGAAVLLSFPRDLWLELGDGGGKDKLNAALPFGGPELLIKTLQDNFDVDIDHYVQVDFAQFAKLVDVVGGVPMPFDRPVRDDNSGLWIPEAGCRVLDGSTALDYVRSRFLQYLEHGEWIFDQSSDLSRIDRQQDFVRRALARAKARGFSNPVIANKLVNVALASVTLDDGFTTSEVLSLASRFRTLAAEDLFTLSLPVELDETAGGASIVRLLAEDAEPILDVFRGRNPDSPSSVTVRLVDASGGKAELSGLTTALADRGFTAAPEVDTGVVEERAMPKSVVRYAPGSSYRAGVLARWLDEGVAVELNEELEGRTVELVVGIRQPVINLASRSAVSALEAQPLTGVVPVDSESDTCG